MSAKKRSGKGLTGKKKRKTNVAKKGQSNWESLQNKLGIKREDMLPTPYKKYSGPAKYLTSDSEHFDALLNTSYAGFVVDDRSDIEPAFHRHFAATLEALRKQDLFQYDIVQAGGSRLSRTYVRRTLVGDPGITYKYLGLRIFAHSWGKSGKGGGIGVSPALRAVRSLNEQVKARTKLAHAKVEQQQAKKKAKRRTCSVGSCDFNLTLINMMEPTGTTGLKLKPEPSYGMGPCSVSWHADSSLRDFSSIAVYNLTKGESDWRIGLRVSPNADPAGVTPPVVMPLQSGGLYYLVGNFNHHRQHAVLAGSTQRYSSTHRVAVQKDATWARVARRAQTVLDGDDAFDVLADSSWRRLSGKESSDRDDAMAQQVRMAQNVLDQLEFDWIRHYWAQGDRHDQLHVWWQDPMRKLLAFWKRLEVRTGAIIERLLRFKKGDASLDTSCALRICELLIAVLPRRNKQRQAWDERLADKVFKRLDPGFQPVECPTFDDQSPLPKDLSTLIKALKDARKRMGGGDGGGVKAKKTAGGGREEGEQNTKQKKKHASKTKPLKAKAKPLKAKAKPLKAKAKRRKKGK